MSESVNQVMEHCPQCGEQTERFFEGYCADCCCANQQALDAHNAGYDEWESLAPEKRSEIITNAIRLALGTRKEGTTP